LDGAPIPADPTVEERFQVCLEHIRNGIQFGRDADRTLIDFRKHLGWYTKGLPGGKKLRTELFQVTALEQVETLLQGYLDRHLEGAEAA
jgi:tRNA-dihydrouridine synthase